jgi:outer membrane receptor for ferrienterochelin and colicin
MFEAHIIMTEKSYSPKAQFSCFGEDKIHAMSLTELKQELAKRYGASWKHKVPMYRDKQDGSTVRCGWVVGFRASDWSHSPVQKWLQQDWVSIRECKEVEL